MHKRRCAKQNGSSVQCTGARAKHMESSVQCCLCGGGVQCTRGVQSEQRAACNAQEGVCKAKWEQRAMLCGRAMENGSSVQCTGGCAKQNGNSVQRIRCVQRNREQRAMHKKGCAKRNGSSVQCTGGCAKHYGSGVQCTTGGVQSKMGAVCNAQEACRASGKQRAMHKKGCAKQNGSSVQCSGGVQSKWRAACNAQEACKGNRSNMQCTREGVQSIMGAVCNAQEGACKVK